MLLTCLLPGCEAGSGDGLDVAGRPLDEGGDVPLAATLDSIQSNVFDAACIVCHAGAGAPLGLRLDETGSYTNLVGVPSSQQPSLLRVEPGNPGDSYLVRKIEGTADTGARMPLGGPPLPGTTIAFVRQWIAEGALPAETGAAGHAPVVVSLDPAPGSIADELPNVLVVGFDREIDQSTVHAVTFLLERSGDGRFGNDDDVLVSPVTVAAAASNSRVVMFDLSGVAPSDDVYRVVVRGGGAGGLLSLDAVALDGEFAGRLPSGDGDPGGDFVATFSVVADGSGGRER